MQLSSLFVLLFAAVWVSAQQASSQTKWGVVGLTGGVKSNGERPSRPGINGLHKAKGPAWDLYVQALAAFQAVPESDKRSYFQIVGIHGLPFVPWNGVNQVSGGGGMYCPHGEIQFATWHRPFLALYEQELVAHAKKIAAKYTGSNKAKYVAAAETLRIPYWDWARDASLPASTTATTLTVNTPTGKKSIRNPLYSYKFQKFPFTYANFGGSIGQYSQTMRCPSTANSNASPRNSVVNSNLKRDASYLKNAVYLTFTRTSAYNSMATEQQGGYSFESPHNTVHNDIGCGNPTGHMTNLGWSAFDPIFMLHHANVDRLIAMWQAAHPSAGTISGTQRVNSAMWGTAAGTQYTANTGLKPFYRKGGASFWTSAEQKSTKAFGYTYPELQDWKYSAADLQKSVVKAVNTLYGTSSNRAAKRSIEGEFQERGLLDGIIDEVTGLTTQYTAEISVDREDLELPCTINMFLGDDLAGTFTLLGMPKNGTSYGNILLPDTSTSITTEVADIIESPSDALVQLLSNDLRVEMTTASGEIKSVLNVPSLKVNVQVDVVRPAASEFEFPEYLNTTKLAVKLRDLL